MIIVDAATENARSPFDQVTELHRVAQVRMPSATNISTHTQIKSLKIVSLSWRGLVQLHEIYLNI